MMKFVVNEIIQSYENAVFKQTLTDFDIQL
jgi:hypothetical protein